jgi:tetratricopeptide (TPR) repeat protein/predicted Ser/Thr protein kinase
MESEALAAEAVVDHAFQRGWVEAEEFQRRLAAGSPRLDALRAAVDPSHLDELAEVYRRSLQAPKPTLAPEPTGSPRGLARERVGPYAIVRELARGGMGVVYVARKAGLDRDMALKLMLSGQATPDEIQRFMTEARTASRLHHRNVVAIHDVGSEEGQPYFVMDLVQGESLKQLVDREGPLPARRAAELTAKLAGALAYAHEHAVLHRDLKPHNVLMDGDGEPVLTDFGLAKDVSAEEGLTQTGQVMGTPGYMPPEQAGGELERIDRRADVYSLGATLYHLLTGLAPFRGATFINVINKVITQPAESVRKMRPEVAVDLDTICAKCLEKEPEARYATMSALAEDLRRYLADEPIHARRTTLAERGVRWVRRNRVISAVLGSALFLLGLGLGGSALWASRSRAAEQADLIAAARRSAEEAWVKAQDVDLGEEPSAPSLDLAVSHGLRALTEAQRWLGLAPESGVARERAQQAAMHLGRVALEAKQWSLAAEAFDQAERTGHEVDAARSAREEVGLARKAEIRRRVESVRHTLSEARQGALRARADGLESAVAEISRYRDPEVIVVLAEELESAQRALETGFQAAAGTFAFAAGIDPDALRRALRRHVGRTPETDPRRTDDRALVDRMWQLREEHESVFEGFYASQAQALGRGGADAAAICARSLGHMLRGLGRGGGASDRRAVSALCRYLWCVGDEVQAGEAARALGRIGDPRALELLEEKRAEFDPDGAFARLLRGPTALLFPSSWAAEIKDPALRAEFHARRREHRLALRALEGAPASARVVWGRAQALQGLREHARALRECEQGLALGGLSNSQRHDLQVGKILCLQLLGRSADSLKAAEAVLAKAPDDPRWLVLRGTLAVGVGDYVRAAACIEKVFQAPPVPAEAFLLLAKLKIAQGDQRGALTSVERALLIDGAQPSALLFKGTALLGLGRTAQATQVAKELLELDPQMQGGQLLLALCHSQSYELDRARAIYDEILENAPEFAEARLQRGMLRLGALFDDEGEEDFRFVLRSRPTHPELHRDWALALSMRERWGEAHDHAQKAEAAHPTLGAWARGFHEAHVLHGRLEDPKLLAQSLGTLQMARAGNKGVVRALSKRLAAARGATPAVLVAIGSAAWYLGERGPALMHFRRATLVNPSFSEAWAWLAMCALDEEDYALGGKYAQEALTHNRDDVVGLYCRGRVRQHQGKLRAAVEDWGRALALEPDHEGARWSRALGLAILGERAPALADLRYLAARDAYGLVWLSALAGEESQHAAAYLKALSNDASQRWGLALVRWATGALNDEGLLAGITSSRLDLQDSHRSEALCYLGMRAERESKPALARKHYLACVATEASENLEFKWAEARLKELPE